VKNGVFWDVTPCVILLRSVRRLLVTASVVPSSPILVTLMKEVLSFTETSVFTRATRRNIPEDTILLTRIVSIDGDILAECGRILCEDQFVKSLRNSKSA
jgi:hypothetical protein